MELLKGKIYRTITLDCQDVPLLYSLAGLENQYEKVLEKAYKYDIFDSRLAKNNTIMGKMITKEDNMS